MPAADAKPVVWVCTNEMANDSGTLRCDLPQAPKVIATITIAATLRTRIGVSMSPTYKLNERRDSDGGVQDWRRKT